MSEPVVSGSYAMVTVGESMVTRGKQEKPLVPSINRQQNGAALQQLTVLTNRLKTTTDQLDAQQLVINELQARDEDSKQAIQELTLRIDSCEKNNQYLRTTLDGIAKSIGINLGPPLQMPDSSANPSAPSQISDLTSAEEEQLSNIVKEAFGVLYGITKFHPKDHGLYPMVSNNHQEWPHKYKNGRRVDFHRFNFSQGLSYASPCNNDSFQAWIEYSLNQGAGLIGLQELPRRVLNCNTVTRHCVSHFKYLQWRVRDYFKSPSDLPLVAGIKHRGEGLDEPLAGDFPSVPVADVVIGPILGKGEMAINPFLLPGLADYPTALHTSVMGLVPSGSENVDKLTIRTRKRKYLMGDNATYKLLKYDGFFTIGGTSDDEAVEVTNGHGEAVEEFHARPWAFASDKHVKCQEAVDATPDPQPSTKQTVCRRGANVVDSPLTSKTVKTGVLSWMVKPEILEANPQWLVAHQVYSSGPEWGEEGPRDPVPKTKVSKRVKFEDKALNLDEIHQAQEEWRAA